MSKILVSKDNPRGLSLEDVLSQLRHEVIGRCAQIDLDKRPEFQHVLNNNVRILEHLNAAIALASDSTQTIEKSFGPHASFYNTDPR